MFIAQRLALSNAWQQRSAADRRALTLLAAVAVPVILVWGLWLPTQAARQAAVLENEQAQSLLNDIRQSAPQLSGLSGASKVAASALPQRVQLLASNAGLAMERMESDPAGVRVAMNNVRLSTLMSFFQQCRSQGIRVLEAQITRDASNNTNQVRLRLGV
ncbi:MAG: type II secretion system protein GspM [Pseudomonadota bacterium]